MSNFFKSIYQAIASLFKKKETPITVPDEPVVDPVDDIVVDNPSDDNIDTDKPDDGGNYEVYPEDAEKLYYPKAVRSERVLRTRGYYKKKYPLGAIVHFTAGRSRNKADGGKLNSDTHAEMGEKSLAYADRQDSYAYFLIDRDGNVYQNFPLDRWGYHAGDSSWPGLFGNVSDELVGIEIQCAGKLQDYYQNSEGGTKYACPEGKLAAWFTRPNNGDLFFDKEKEARYSDKKDNIKKGWYHIYSPEQEEALIELLIWLKRNNPDVFQFKNVAGHDEVAPNRKSDPGASLTMTMPEFRKLLNSEYSRRYDSVVSDPTSDTPVNPSKIVLKRGDKGDKVVTLQTHLTKLGYSLGSIDGDFGSKTEKAVVAFQKDNGIADNGVVNEITWSTLVEKVNSKTTTSTFAWNNSSWDSYLVDALKKSNLISLKPEDASEFGTNKDAIIFWGNILVEMAKWESSWKPETEYKESFGVWSRGLFQLSLSDKNNYSGITFTSEEDVHDPKKNIEAAVIILDKLVTKDNRIAGKVSNAWKGGARYWSVLRGDRDYTAKALLAIKNANN